MQTTNLSKITTLDEGWFDKDNVMLDACFQLLTDCIKQERLHEHWNQSEQFAAVKGEIEALYKWWRQRVKAERVSGLDPIWTKHQYQQDNEMLIRPIKVRQYLWK